MSFDSLVKRCEGGRQDSRKLEAYYCGDHRLDALGVGLPPTMRVLEMISSFPKLAVDVLVEALNVEGFAMSDDDKTPALLRRWWQANDLDTVSHLVWAEALVQGLGFFIVGPGTDDTPRITGHSAKGIAVARDHMGDVVEAVRLYGPHEDRRAAHYLPGSTAYYAKNAIGRWVLVETRSTGTDLIPVIPVANQIRIDEPDGRSEMLEVMGLADAESRSLTNLQVAQELMAMPQRYLFADGMESFRDQNGNPIDKLQAYMSSVWTGPKDAKAGQFPGADLGQIINVIKLYGQKVSSITGIPPSMLGISTDNPASAEAMRVAKERLITKGEQKQHLFGDALESVMRVALAMYPPADEPQGVETLETVWRDVATPSQSAKAANMLQAHSQGVLSGHTAREHLALTPEQRAYEDRNDGDVGQLNRTVGIA